MLTNAAGLAASNNAQSSRRFLVRVLLQRACMGRDFEAEKRQSDVSQKRLDLCNREAMLHDLAADHGARWHRETTLPLRLRVRSSINVTPNRRPTHLHALIKRCKSCPDHSLAPHEHGQPRTPRCVCT